MLKDRARRKRALTAQLIIERIDSGAHAWQNLAPDVMSVCRVPSGSRDSAGGILHRSLRAKRRSEEHTSELQSRGHLVCRLLLEKTTSSNRVCRSLARSTI